MTDASTLQILILSDVHYAGAEERTRVGYDLKAIESVPLRWLVKLYRRYIWLRDPLGQNHLLQRIMDAAPDPDLVVANGDYTCDTRFIGVTDPAAQASAAECLTIIRTRYAGHSKKTSRIPRFHAVIGDHELGKKVSVQRREVCVGAALKPQSTSWGYRPFGNSRLDVTS